MALKLLIVIVLCLSFASLIQANICSTRADCNNQGDCESDTCICDPGFTGINCETFVSCAGDPCGPSETCFDIPGDFVCCPPGMNILAADNSTCLACPTKGTPACTERIIDAACRYLQLTLTQEEIPVPCLPIP